MFSFEICEIFNNIFFYRTHPVAASAFGKNREKKGAKLEDLLLRHLKEGWK